MTIKKMIDALQDEYMAKAERKIKGENYSAEYLLGFYMAIHFCEVISKKKYKKVKK